MVRRVLLVILTVSLLFCGVHAACAYESSADAMYVLEEVMDRLNKYHLDRPEIDVLVDGAVGGMLQSVGDPYTEYFSDGELDSFANSLDGNLYGIGVELKPEVNYLSVANVVPGSPAEKSGIKAGDVIIAVDDEELKGLDFNMVIDKIRGPRDSKVKIKVNRSGGGTIDFVINREKIDLPTVEYSLLKDQTGYIYVGSFGEETTTEFESAFNELTSEGINSLILDLRNNGGGYLQAAVDLASKFLPAGSKVVSIADKEGNGNEYNTSGNPLVGGLPLVVLVNENSASAAEVLAGALRDHERAELVGVQTYGKGLLQTIIPLINGGALKVTTHRYYTPAGTSLDMLGLIPDRQVMFPELQLVAAWQELRDQDYQLEYKLSERTAYVNGIEIGYPVTPIVESGHVFLPLRFTLEALGYRVHSAQEGIRISGYGNTLEVYPGHSKVLLNSAVINLERPVQVREGISYIPVSYLKLLNLSIEENKDSVCVFAA